MRNAKAALLLLLVLLTGCGNGSIGKIVLTTGFRSDEVFRIEDTSCSLSELMVYLADIQTSYALRYGDGIWEVSESEAQLEEGIKEAALSRISQVKTMNLLSKEMATELTAEEKTLALEAARIYYEGLSAEAVRSMDDVSLDTVERMYAEYALADKLYRYIIRDINPEISDDEARTITVQQIFIHKDTPSGAIGSDVAYAMALEAYREAHAGIDFKELYDRYSDAPEFTLSFGKGEMEADYETAAFNLGTDEISDIIETEEGYYILKCLTTFNREETDANKLKIVATRKREVFAEEYDTFADALAKELNESLWETVTLLDDTTGIENGFFTVYAQLFGDVPERD